MDYQEGKEKFITAWGVFASQWGINRTMAQVHALLLISHEPLTCDEIMDELQVSRGNCHQNLHGLIDWGLVYKDVKMGERKDYFFAEKDILTIIRQIIIHRKKKELEPVLKILDELANVEPGCAQSQCFCNVIKDLRTITHKADLTLDTIIKANPTWFSGSIFKGVQ